LPLSQQALELTEPQDAWDYVLEAIVYGTLVYAPLPFGSITETSREVALGSAALLVLVLLAKLIFSPGTRFIWSYTYVPIALFLALVTFQLVPLPAHVIQTLSPATYQEKTRLLSDLPAAAPLLQWMTLTFYPFATRHDLRLVIAVSTYFVVIINVFRRPEQIKRLLLVISAIGVGVAGYALYEKITGAQMIFGRYPIVHANSGPFLNHSHFSQFINLSIGAMLALLLVQSGKIDDGTRDFGDAYSRLRESGAQLIFVLSLAIVLSAATIFFSEDRMGVVSMALAGGITAGLLAFRRPSRGASTFLLIGAIGAIGLVLLGAFIPERLSTLLHLSTDNSGLRWEVLRDLYDNAWKRFPIFGTGLGTHQYIFPMFDRSTEFKLAVHAENEFAELMEEAGIIGVVLCLWFVGLTAANYVRCVWQRHKAIHLASYGLGYGLLAILFHSLTDFGQHDMSNALLTATFAGLLVSLRRMGRAHSASTARQRAPVAQWMVLTSRIGAAVAGGVVFALLLPEADKARQAEVECWDPATRLEHSYEVRGWDNTVDDDYKAVIRLMDPIRQLVPENVAYQYFLADYRWRLIIKGRRDPATGRMDLQDEIVFARRIADDLNAIRLSCPVYAPPYALAGNIERFVLNEPIGEDHIRTAYRLDANQPFSCYAAATLDVSGLRWDQAMQEAKRAMALRPAMRYDCLELFAVVSGRLDLAHDLVRGNRPGLSELADILRNNSAAEAAKMVATCRKEASQLLREEAAQPGASADTLARAAQEYESDQDYAKAIDLWERALVLNYGQVDWRFSLAKLYFKAGRYAEAESAAGVILQLSPRRSDAETLMKDARAHREAASPQSTG
jgi:tetratricopeptide (TPR) repeat protein